MDALPAVEIVRIPMAKSLRNFMRRLVARITSPGIALLLGEPFFCLLRMRHRVGSPNLLTVRNVLVIRLDEIGDVVMTTPFLRELRRNLPKAGITLVVKPSVFNLVELCPYVNEVLTYDPRPFISGRFWEARQFLRAVWMSLRHFWARRFDLVIVPRKGPDFYHARFLAYLSGARWRVAYSDRRGDSVIARNGRAHSFYTHLFDDHELKHEVASNMDVIRFLGGNVQNESLEVWVNDEDEATAARIFRENGVTSEDLVIGLGPSGGNSVLKQWPIGRFIELGRCLVAEHGARILVLGGPEDETLGREVQEGIGAAVINATGKTTLRQTAALLKHCQLYVGNDAGIMHLAAAVQIPVVAIFGPSCPHSFGPWGKGHQVVCLGLPCSPCARDHQDACCPECTLDRPRCMHDIAVAQVRTEAELVLHDPSPDTISRCLVNCPCIRDLPCPESEKTGWPWTDESPRTVPGMPDGSDWPRISIVTPSFNQGAFIEETIRSVLLQGYPDLEYAIVDGDSTDSSVEIIRKYSPWLTYWVSEKDRGQSHAINKGLQRATGHILAYLNSDDVYAPGALFKVACALATQGKAWCCGDAVEIDDKSHKISDWRKRTPRRWTDLMSGKAMTAQPSTFWTRDLWLECGPLDESMFFSMDWDLYCKFLLAGHRPVRIQHGLSSFRTHPATKSSLSQDRLTSDQQVILGKCLSRSSGFDRVLWGICLLRARSHDMARPTGNWWLDAGRLLLSFLVHPSSMLSRFHAGGCKTLLKRLYGIRRPQV